MKNTSIKNLLLCAIVSLSAHCLSGQQNELSGTLKINDQYTFPSTDGTAGQVLSTDGNGTTTWVTGAGGSSPWTESGTNVYRAAGRVGIGTTSPLDELQVEAAAGTSNIRIKSPTGAGYILNYQGSTLRTQMGFSGSNLIMANNHPSGDAYMTSQDDLFLQAGGVTRMTIDETGAIGAGVAVPQSDFHLKAPSGNTDLRLENGTGGGSYVRYYDGTSPAGFIGHNNINLLLRNQLATGDVYVQSEDDIQLWANGATRLFVEETGDIGIGNTSPSAKLHMSVTGNNGIRIDGDDTGDVRLRMTNGGGNHYLFDDDSDGHALKLESAGDFAINVNGTNQKFRIDGPTGDIDMYDNVDISGQLTVSNDLELRGGDPTLDFWNNSPPGVGARIKFDDNSSSGGNSGVLEITNFQVAGSIEIKNGSQLNMRMNDTNMYAYTDLSPFTHKTVDLGLDGKAWDNVYADDYINQGAAAFTDRALSDEILMFPPTEKTEGMFDYKTERGDIELDPNFLPPGLSEGNGILIDEMAAYNYKANYEQQQQIADLQAENAQLKEQLREILEELRK